MVSAARRETSVCAKLVDLVERRAKSGLLRRNHERRSIEAAATPLKERGDGAAGLK